MTTKAHWTKRLDTTLLAVATFGYVAWAIAFILRSATHTSEGWFFALFDDAMVSLRYAWNLAHGNGLVWNPGEYVEGATSFLFTLTMVPGAALLGKSGAALLVQAMAIPIVLGCAFYLRRLGRSVDERHVGAISALSALAYYPLSYWSLMGMETGLLTGIMLLALCLVVERGKEAKRIPAFGLLLGAMFATRPDAIVPALVILFFRGIWVVQASPNLRACRQCLFEPAMFLGIVVGLTLFRIGYYGQPFPNTYYLKMANWPLQWRVLNGWKFVQPFLEDTLPLLFFAGIALVGHRDSRRLLLASVAVAVFACQVWVGGDAWSYWRMLTPAVMLLIVLAVDGASYLVRIPFRRWSRPQPRWLAPLVALLCLGKGMAAANVPFMEEALMKVPAYTVPMNQIRTSAAFDLARWVAPTGRVAVFAAGVLPYYSGLRGVDAFGKCDAFIARLPGLGFNDGRTVTPGHNKFDLSYSIKRLRPDAIFDALAWARYDSPDILEFVQQNYTESGSFWLLRGSPHVRWEALPNP